MLPTFKIGADYNSLLFLMASISPKVADSLENELYRAAADSDMATDDYILTDSLKLLLADLTEIGIDVGIDYGDYTNDAGQLSQFLQFVQLLLPNTLYTLIQNNPRVYALIKAITEGSIGGLDTAIGIYLTELGGLDGGLAVYPDLTDYLDQVYPTVTQTPVFTDYLKNLIALKEEERPAETADDVRHEQYRDFIREFVGRMSDAVNAMEALPEYGEMARIQNLIIRDLTAADNFTDYAYLFLESHETLPDELHSGYDRRWYRAKVSRPWYFAYHQLRRLPVAKPMQKVIACVSYALHPTWDSYSQDIGIFRQAYPDQEVDRIITALYAQG